jgi:uncharacterized protein (DUF1330 family)
MFSEYQNAVPATLEAFVGKFIVRGGNLKLLEGEWPHPRLVIIEFPSREAAKSAGYQRIIELRLSSTITNLVRRLHYGVRSAAGQRIRKMLKRLSSCYDFCALTARQKFIGAGNRSFLSSALLRQDRSNSTPVAISPPQRPFRQKACGEAI